MLPTTLYIFQIALLALFYAAYSKRDEVLWGITTTLSGILVFIYYFEQSPIEALLNLAPFLISIVYFFIDLIANHTGETYEGKL